MRLQYAAYIFNLAPSYADTIACSSMAYPGLAGCCGEAPTAHRVQSLFV